MRTRALPASRRPGQEGFALIMAILSLMLLTVLGLTLAATTTTEIQIATNLKWSRQAFFNAEAGIEVGKRVLRGMNWATVLPAARAGSWLPGSAPAPPTAPFGGAYRNFENVACDTLMGVGYGVVLNNNGEIYENVSVIPNPAFPAAAGGIDTRIRGAFTLWVRRPPTYRADATIQDAVDNNSLILTAEGTAPYTPPAPGGASAGVIAANRAVQTMEVRLDRTVLSPCGARAGQTGGAQSGANFASCVTFDDSGLPGGLTGTGDDLGGR